MKHLAIEPEIYSFDSCIEFISELKIGKEDLIIINENVYNFYFKKYELSANIIFFGKYGNGEPSDKMVEDIYNDIKDIYYKRVIAIGGESVLDVSKLFALKTISPVSDLFDHKLEIIKDKELILISTTSGTDSEITNISILESKTRNTKLVLEADELYADYAVIIPEILEELQFKFMDTCSMDALIHAIESSLSPNATSYTEMFSYKAMEIILKGYKEISKNGPKARIPLLKDFLLASNYVEIAVDITGCEVVHVMSYPLEVKYNIPHGEANYQMFIGIFKTYQALNTHGRITKLNKFLEKILECREEEVCIKIEELLNVVIPKKTLREYGVLEDELMEFTESVVARQRYFVENSYIRLTKDIIYKIYKSIY